MMKIKKSDLLCIAAKPAQYPAADTVEIAFAGRSNVGKSSLINLLLGRKNLARVSGSPGKTRTINFYTINDDAFRVVDLPGYGYAKVSKSMSAEWGDMIETYLKQRDNLAIVVQLVDSRHEPSALDVQMYDWLKAYGMDGLVVATKADKISNNEWAKNRKAIRSKLGMGPEDILIPVSALKRTGTGELLDVIGQIVDGWHAEAEGGDRE